MSDEETIDPYVYEEEWGVCGRIDHPIPTYANPDSKEHEWNRGLLVRAGGIGRLWLRSIVDPQGRLDGSSSPLVSAHTRAKLTAVAPCMYRLLEAIRENPDRDWSEAITNVLTRARTGKGWYFLREKKFADIKEDKED